MSQIDRARRERAARDQLGGRFVVVLVCWLLLVFAAPAVRAQTEPEAEKPVTEIKPEQFELKPGEQFAYPSLVVRPAKLAGALSWTLETRRHRGEIMTFDQSYDGKFVATGGEDGAIRIWDLTTGALVRVLLGHTSRVLDIAWSPDGQVIASTGGYDCKLRLWQASTGQPLRVFENFKEYTRQLAWSPAGDRLAVVGGDSGWIWMWDAKAEQGRPVAEIGKPVLALNWSPAGDQLAFTVAEGSASIVDATSGRVEQTLGAAATVHYSACWSPDGTKLLLASADKSVVYKMPELTVLKKLPSAGWGPVWSPDSKSVFVMSGEGPRLWNLETDKITQRIDHYGWPLLAVSWRQPDQLVAVSKTTLVRWDVRAGKRSASYGLGGIEPPLWTDGRPIVTGLNTQRLQTWDAKTAALLHTYKGHTGAITDAAWSPDGGVLASSSWDKTIHFWEPGSDTSRATLAHDKAPVLCLAWSPDGKTLASGANDNLVRLWNAEGKLQSTLTGHTKPVTTLAWTVRGDLLASGSEDSTVRMWDPNKAELKRELRISEQPNALAFHPNGTILAGGAADEQVRLWLVASGKPVMKDLRGDAGRVQAATALAWSPDGRFLLVGRYNNTVQNWEWRKGTLSEERYPHSTVNRVGFMSDGRYIFAGTQDRMVHFWDRNAGSLVGYVLDQGNCIILLNAKGHYRVTPSRTPDIVYVVQTPGELLTLKPAEFAERFGWKNDPEKVSLPGN